MADLKSIIIALVILNSTLMLSLAWLLSKHLPALPRKSALYTSWHAAHLERELIVSAHLELLSNQANEIALCIALIEFDKALLSLTTSLQRESKIHQKKTAIDEEQRLP